MTQAHGSLSVRRIPMLSIASRLAPRWQGNRRVRVRRPLFDLLEERTVLAVSIASSFAALDFNHSGGYTPPDTSGAAGTAQYVETVNQQTSIYNKSNGGTLATASLSTFFFTTGALTRADSTSGLSDPIVTYNDQIGRFIIGDQDVNFTTHVSAFDIAVSKTGTPTTLTTADWTFYKIVTTEAGYDADYPGNFGYNHDAFVFTLNMFSTTGGAGHVQVVSVNNTDLANKVASPGTFKNDLNDFAVRPTTMHDSVAGDPMWLVTEHGNNTSIDVIKMGNVLTSTPTFAYTTLAVTPYTQAALPKNPNGTQITNNMDSRILKSAEYNNVLVTSHTVAASATQDVAQWYAVDLSGATPVLKDQGRVSAGNNTYVFFPAMDINASGQIGMTYMKSGNDTTTDYMSMYVTGRTSTDPAGTMETAILVPTGTGLANYKDFSTGGRAGDLSGINLDPVNGSFWAANEFANTQASANWGTAVANFSVSNPLPSTDLAVTSSGPSSLNVTAGPVTATYTITVTNNGPVTAQNFVLTDTLPTGSTFVSLTQASGTDVFTISQSGSTAKATIASLVSGATDTFTLVVTAPANLANGAVFSNVSAVSSDNPDSVSANNSSTVAGSIINTNVNSDVAVTVSTIASGTEGGAQTYTVTVTNKGPNAATGVVLTDTLNTFMKYVSATTTVGTVSQASGVVTVTIGNLAVNASVTITINTKNQEDGTLANNASVTSTSPDSNATNNVASSTTLYTEAPITVSASKTSKASSVTNFAAGTFTHASGVEAASAFIATINWGDGTNSTGVVTLSGTTYTVTGSHTFVTTGRHTISITVVEAGSTPNSPEIPIDKAGDDHPGKGPYGSQDVVKIRVKAKKPKAHVHREHERNHR